ncbi:MAG: DUF551 domain-containing protein [Oscillospiraceae bacterium]|nr:DUF551 domain-containing protein [Oscillospiraceae bacterium]
MNELFKNDLKEWIPCSSRMPYGIADEIQCLVTCKEWNIFDGKWEESKVRILSYSPKLSMWNTKSNIKVEAWMPLPKPYSNK